MRGSILTRIRNDPTELGTALDETFEQTLQDIPEEKSQRAILLFQYLYVAIRPLRVNELKEIFTNPADPKPGPNEEFVPSAYSPLISITEEKSSKIIQFSSHWVNEFLTSSRLRTSGLGNISQYHISLESAHAVMARVCLAALLRLTRNVNKTYLERMPLALYAARHWVDHAKFPNVESQVQDLMKRLFDSNEPYLEAWLWINDVDNFDDKGHEKITRDLAHPPSPRAAPLYYAALCGFSELVGYLAAMHPDDLKDKRGHHGTPLHAASYMGHIDTARVLIGRMEDVDIANKDHESPLHAAFYGGKQASMQLLLENKATVNSEDILGNTPLHHASLDGQLQVVDLLLSYNANPNAGNRNGWTPLHRAALRGQVEVARRLLVKEADVNAQSRNRNTPLHIASISGKLEVVKVLLEHEADVRIQGENGWMPHEAARENGHDEIEKLLWESSYEFRWYVV